jgi:hypothetical protein
LESRARVKMVSAAFCVACTTSTLARAFVAFHVAAET